MTLEQVQNDPLCKVYHQLPDEVNARIALLKDKGKEYYDLLKALTPCREVSIALTKLEECSMWATKGIVQTDKLNKPV